MKSINYNLKNAFLSIFFIFLLCLNSFAVAVSDNDGSAFITKAEFDSLKNEFQAQLDAYNNNIDSKLESAISSYLAGIKVEKQSRLKMDSTFQWTFPIICMNNSEWNNLTSKYYSYEIPNIKDISFQLRGWGNNAAGLGWTGTTALSSTASNKATGGCVCFCKNWHEVPKKYNEMINISNNYVNVTSGGSTWKAYEILNVGKGRHVTENYSYGVTRDFGHAQMTKTYWGYTGIIGIGVSGSSGTRNNMTTSTFSNWTESQWTRKGGCGKNSEVGWGGQTTNAFVLPANNINLNGARSWASTYTSCTVNVHGQGHMSAFSDSSTRENSFDWENGSYIRQWIYTGNSDAPATSVYGWCFDMKKPQTATENFEGCIMYYNNDIAMTTVSSDTWYGFHSWTPKWFWRYKAAGSIGTAPSSSEFSKLPAKQVYYEDASKNIHTLDEGLFLLGLTKPAISIVFTAKWSVIDTSLPAGQKIKLKISYTPFNSAHDNKTNLKYKVNDGTLAADQQVSVGTSLKINVEGNKNTDALYMMWEPVTSGAYLGLSEISEFLVTTE